MDTLPQGQSSKSPAFSFYAKEWLAATLSWALDARGAYATLMAYQWDAGAVPGDDLPAIARVLGVSTPKARLIWSVVSSKFERGPDGQWRNPRLEQERDKQKARRDALKANGARGGRPPNNQTPNQNETNRFTETKPKPNLNESLSSSSSFASSGDSKNESQKQQHAAPLISSAVQIEKRREYCAFVGSKIEVPNGLHAELRKSHGGPDPEKELQDWYLEVNERADVDTWRIPQGKEFYPWFKSLYARRFPAPVINSAKPSDVNQAAVTQALETRRRRAEMEASGMSSDAIEAVFEREYEQRKAASA